MNKHNTGHDSVFFLEFDGNGAIKRDRYFFVGLIYADDIGKISVDGL